MKRSKIISAKTSSDVLKSHRELALRLKGERTLANVKPLCGVKNKRQQKRLLQNVKAIKVEPREVYSRP